MHAFRKEFILNQARRGRHPSLLCLLYERNTVLFIYFLWILIHRILFYIQSRTWDTEFNRGIWEDSFLRALAHTPNSLCRTQTRTLCSPSLRQLGDLCVRVSVLWIIPCNISPSNQRHSDYADCKTRASVNTRENREVREARINLVHVCLLFWVMCVTPYVFLWGCYCRLARKLENEVSWEYVHVTLCLKSIASLYNDLLLIMNLLRYFL